MFLKLIGDMAKFRGDSAFSTWLYRLVVNACVDRARRVRAEPIVDDPVALDRVTDPVSLHDEVLARAKSSSPSRTRSASLPPKLRLPILLRYFDELSYVRHGCRAQLFDRHRVVASQPRAPAARTEAGAASGGPAREGTVRGHATC